MCQHLPFVPQLSRVAQLTYLILCIILFLVLGTQGNFFQVLGVLNKTLDKTLREGCNLWTVEKQYENRLVNKLTTAGRKKESTL